MNCKHCQVELTPEIKSARSTDQCVPCHIENPTGRIYKETESMKTEPTTYNPIEFCVTCKQYFQQPQPECLLCGVKATKETEPMTTTKLKVTTCDASTFEVPITDIEGFWVSPKYTGVSECYYQVACGIRNSDESCVAGMKFATEEAAKAVVDAFIMIQTEEVTI